MLGNPPTKTYAYDWQSLARAAERAFGEGELSKAEDLAWEGLSKAKRMGEFEPRLAISLSNLAMIQRTRGQFDRAEDLSNIALRIFQAVDARGEMMAKALLNSACFYHDEGRWGEARRLYAKAISLLETAFHDAMLCRALCLYARLCSDTDKYAQAETLLKRVVSLEPSDKQTMTLCYLTAAQNSMRRQRLSRAEQNLADAEKFILEGVENRLLWKSSLLSLRGDLLLSQYQASKSVSGSTESDLAGRKTALIEAYEHALDIREQALGPFHPGCGEILRKLAAFHFEMSEYRECETLLRRALSIGLSSRGPYHIDCLRCLELSGLLFRATSRHQEAEEMEDRTRQVEKVVREIARETYIVWGEPDE